MTIIVVSQAGDGRTIDVFNAVDEAVVNGETIRRPSNFVVLVVT